MCVLIHLAATHAWLQPQCLHMGCTIFIAVQQISKQSLTNL